MHTADWILHVLGVIIGIWVMVDLHRDRKGAPAVRLLLLVLACLIIGLSCGNMSIELTR